MSSFFFCHEKYSEMSILEHPFTWRIVFCCLRNISFTSHSVIYIDRKTIKMEMMLTSSQASQQQARKKCGNWWRPTFFGVVAFSHFSKQFRSSKYAFYYHIPSIHFCFHFTSRRRVPHSHFNRRFTLDDCNFNLNEKSSRELWRYSFKAAFQGIKIQIRADD